MIADKPDITSLRIDRSDAGTAPPGGCRGNTSSPLPCSPPHPGFFALRGALSAAVDVETAIATLTSPSQANSVLAANGYVVAQRKAAVASKGTGRLVYLGVEEGDKVRKGDHRTARRPGYGGGACQGKGGPGIARADSFGTRNTLERTRKLFASNLASQADLDAAESQYLKVRANIVSARAAVEQADVAMEYTRIRAPFDGTVLTKDADVGEIVAPFASSANSRGAVVSMADMGSLQVEADVSESNITRVSVGQPCEITLDAYPDVRYRGTVHKIVPTADRAKATVMTKVAFTRLDERVLPDMSAKVASSGGALRFGRVRPGKTDGPFDGDHREDGKQWCSQSAKG